MSRSRDFRYGVRVGKWRRVLRLLVILAVAAFALLSAFGLGIVLQASSEKPAGKQAPQVQYGDVDSSPSTLNVASADVQTSDIDIYKLWQGTNAERTKAGIGPLVLDNQLDRSAQLKCDDMVARDYWQHNTPDGVQPWTFMDRIGITYQSAGENLAYGYRNAGQAVTAWMNSTGHKTNILNPLYTNVGFAVCKSPNYTNLGPQVIIVQHFTHPR